MAARRLGPADAARLVRDLRAVGLDAEPRRRPDGHRGLLLGRRDWTASPTPCDRHHRAGACEEGVRSVCFPGARRRRVLDDVEPTLRTRLRKGVSPRHVPDRFGSVDLRRARLQRQEV
ncbi:acetoacetate--CoA ligase family protein [Pseudonocardia sp. MCCB 268]|nr:acetoacetate--CoA ligase family protein [Pseudonocardia cytotoxica]